jgi:hypothetical protein
MVLQQSKGFVWFLSLSVDYKSKSYVGTTATKKRVRVSFSSYPITDDASKAYDENHPLSLSIDLCNRPAQSQCFP